MRNKSKAWGRYQAQTVGHNAADKQYYIRAQQQRVNVPAGEIDDLIEKLIILRNSTRRGCQ